MVRAGLKGILENRQTDIATGEAPDCDEVLREIQSGDWNLVLVDMLLPGMGGAKLIKRIKELRPKVSVLAMGMHKEEQFAVQALRSGAQGYLIKGCPPEDLLAAIRTIAAGGTHFTPPRGNTGL